MIAVRQQVSGRPDDEAGELPGITNADTELGGTGSNTVTFRNKDEVSLTLEYFLDTDWGYHDIKFGYAQTKNEYKTNFVYTGDGNWSPTKICSLRTEPVKWVTYRVRGGSQQQDAFFAPTTKTPYTDELMIGYEQALTDDMSVGITVTDRKTRDILEDYDLGLYTNVATAGDFMLPLSYFGYDAIPASNYVIGTLAGGKRDCTGAEVTFRKRRTAEDAWQLLASYAYNDAEGSSNSDSDADFQGDLVILDPRAPNMYGPQPGNVKHILKLAGSYAWDNGFEVGAVYAWNSGTVYSRTFLILSRHLPVFGGSYEHGGIEETWVEDGAVGAFETDSYGTLDLRAKYTMDLWDDRYQAEFFLDIFNALDDQAPIRNQDLSSGDGVYSFGQANNWVEPRRLYLGARLSF